MTYRKRRRRNDLKSFPRGPRSLSKSLEVSGKISECIESVFGYQPFMSLGCGLSVRKCPLRHSWKCEDVPENSDSSRVAILNKRALPLYTTSQGRRSLRSSPYSERRAMNRNLTLKSEWRSEHTVAPRQSLSLRPFPPSFRLNTSACRDQTPLHYKKPISLGTGSIENGTNSCSSLYQIEWGIASVFDVNSNRTSMTNKAFAP